MEINWVAVVFITIVVAGLTALTLVSIFGKC